LAALRLDGVYSSPLRRARQTAATIAGQHGLPVEVVDDLTEVDVGRWEGRAWEEIRRTDAHAYEAFMADPCVHPYLGGETMEGVRARVVPAFERLMANHVGRCLVVVAHNGVNRVYLAHVLGISVGRYRSIPQDNCGLSLVRYRDGEVKVATINSFFHLSARVGETK
jgi:alpha-ribazole phosphatase/probable phosphoglycerate mutase